MTKPAGLVTLRPLPNRPAPTGRLTHQQLLDPMDSTNMHVIDARPAEEYAAGHIPRARSLPLDGLEPQRDEPTKDTELVAIFIGSRVSFGIRSDVPFVGVLPQVRSSRRSGPPSTASIVTGPAHRGGCSCCGGRRCRGRTWP
ncbi:rhodanese-like domain-containing protein [Streptomyces sp. KR55]|uniref:rhodanese-like domain-containing protein n=1 Tax=Streptomyces sp. KR55 TaxID=3457425 RepID=UPI003FD3D272